MTGPYMGLAERVGFEPTVRLPVQRFSSSKILMLARAVPVTKRVLWFGIFPTTILSCDARYRAVPCGSFANPFANSHHQPMSAYAAIADFHEAQSHDRLTQSGRHRPRTNLDAHCERARAAGQKDRGVGSKVIGFFAPTRSARSAARREAAVAECGRQAQGVPFVPRWHRWRSWALASIWAGLASPYTAARRRLSPRALSPSERSPRPLQLLLVLFPRHG